MTDDTDLMREALVTRSDSELETLGFGGLVEIAREAGIRDVALLDDRGYTCMPQVEVEERIDTDEVADLACVDRCELVAEKETTYVYLLELTATELPERTTNVYDELVGTCDPTVTEQGLLLSLVGSQEAIRDMLRTYEAAGATPDLYKLAEYDGGTSTLDELTDRQLEILQTAYRMGFYEIPREASTEGVAAEFDLDAATVSEHLQRAERNLIATQLPP